LQLDVASGSAALGPLGQVFEAVDGGDYQDASSRLNRAQAIIDKNVKRAAPAAPHRREREAGS